MSSRESQRQFLLNLFGFVTLTAIAMLAIAPACSAQDIFGRISGTVTDSSGAVVPDAKVTLVNEATRASRDLTTDRSGFYAADDMAVGAYTVVAGKTGFKTTSEKGNFVHAGGRLTVDMKLQIGTVTETVEVAGVAETVNTTSGEVATTITQDQIENLALNQRHYESLIGLVPGAALESSGTNPAALTINYNNSVAETNGQRIDGQNWSVDGGFNLDSGSNNSVFNQVGVDFIQEVTVQTSNYDAEFGRSASSTVNVVTKSGGMHYHGSLFEYVQNNIFNAENAGTKLTNPTFTGYQAVPPFHFNDYGWSFGGPVPFIQQKGKLFFFAGQEFKKFRGVYPGLTTATQGQTFPTAMEAQGNFTDLNPGTPTGLTLVTPANIPASCNGVLYTAPNVINPSCITGDGAAMAALYTQAAKLSLQGGLPTSTSGNNVTFNLPNPLNLREDIIRIDERPTDKQSIYVRYLHDSVDIYNPFSTFGGTPAVPVDPDLRHRPGNNYQIGWVYVISPTFINEAKFNADWHSQRTPPQGTAYLTTTYGFKFIPPLGAPTQFPTGLPQITWTCGSVCNKFPTATPTTVNGPGLDFLEAPTTDINPVDNVTWQKGNHSFKFGGEFARNRKTQNSRVNYTGTINFNSAAGATSNAATGVGSNSTGDPFADALLGNFNSLSQISEDTVGQFRFNDVEAYFQDTWKATRKLSLVLGLRFIYTTPTYTTGNNMTNFDPSTFVVGNEPTFTSVGSGSSLNAASPGLCSGPLTTVAGNPVLTVECNGLVLPGRVPASQVKSVPAATAVPTLLSQFNSTAPRGFFPSEYLPAPRFGFSYSPFDNNKTVVRGGFGIFYDKPEGNLLGQGINSQGYVPWAQTVTINGVNDSLSQFDSAAGVAPVPAPSTISGVNGVNPNLVVARTYTYSFGIEHELPSDTLLRINYVGNLGRHILRGPSINVPSWTAQQGFLPTSVNPNTYACPSGINAAAYGCTGGFANSKINGDQIRPFLGYSSIGFELSDANSNYNSLQASLTKRAGFVSGTFAYTYSKVLGNGGGVGEAYNENPESECPFTCLVSTPANPVLVNGGTTAVKGGTQTGGVVETWQQLTYGRVNFDHTDILAMAFTVEQPFGSGLHGVVGALAKGWSLSGIMHFQTGAPLTATASSNIAGTSISATRRANLVPGQSLDFSGTCPAGKICWVNPNAVVAASTLGAGGAPIGDIIGPNFYQWDMSLRKQFALPWESMKLQFQADAFNVFNHTNWNNPTTNNAGAASFGQITTSLPARVLQFGAHFVF